MIIRYAKICLVLGDAELRDSLGEEARRAVVLRADDVVPEERDVRQVFHLLESHLGLPEIFV